MSPTIDVVAKMGFVTDGHLSLEDWVTGRLFRLDGGMEFESLAYEGVFPMG